MVKVGAATETEMKEKKARVEDALHATRAAVEEGIVPGGGVALLRAQAALDGLDEALDDGAARGRRASCAARSRSRCAGSRENAGVDGSIVVDKVKNGKGAFGFNAATEEYEDLVKAGVIDPTKVVRSALQNAASVASLLLTTEAMVAEKPEKKNGGGGGGMPRRHGRHGRHGHVAAERAGGERQLAPARASQLPFTSFARTSTSAASASATSSASVRSWIGCGTKTAAGSAPSCLAWSCGAVDELDRRHEHARDARAPRDRPCRAHCTTCSCLNPRALRSPRRSASRSPGAGRRERAW